MTDLLTLANLEKLVSYKASWKIDIRKGENYWKVGLSTGRPVWHWFYIWCPKENDRLSFEESFNQESGKTKRTWANRWRVEEMIEKNLNKMFEKEAQSQEASQLDKAAEPATETPKIRLQGIGLIDGNFASEIKAGDTLLWNFGHTSKVQEVTRQTEKSIWIIEEGQGERRFSKTRVVKIMTEESKEQTPAKEEEQPAYKTGKDKEDTTKEFKPKMTYLRKIECDLVEVSCEDLPRITSDDEAEKVLRSIFPVSLTFQEAFVCLYLNQYNAVVGYQHVGLGGIASCPVDRKVIFTGALQCGAVSIILCHNHPSGNLSPRNADLTLTENVAEAAKLLSMRVLDHIILTKNDFTSLNDLGHI